MVVPPRQRIGVTVRTFAAGSCPRSRRLSRSTVSDPSAMMAPRRPGGQGMGVPSRAARLAHAGKYCELWNAGRKDEWVASWRTLIQGDVTMYDPVGTKPKHGFQV